MVVIVSREKGGFPPTWRPGPRRVWMWLFGLIPLGSQTINIEFPESKDGSYRLRDNGSGLLARKWDHHLSLEPHGDGSRYRDRIHLAAGVFTPFVWPRWHSFTGANSVGARSCGSGDRRTPARLRGPAPKAIPLRRGVSSSRSRLSLSSCSSRPPWRVGRCPPRPAELHRLRRLHRRFVRQ